MNLMEFFDQDLNGTIDFNDFKALINLLITNGEKSNLP